MTRSHLSSPRLSVGVCLLVLPATGGCGRLGYDALEAVGAAGGAAEVDGSRVVLDDGAGGSTGTGGRFSGGGGEGAHQADGGHHRVAPGDGSYHRIAIHRSFGDRD